MAYPCDTPVYLYLDDLALNDLALLRYPHANGLPKGLGQSFGLGHLKGEDFGRGEHGEGNIGTERLSHAHGDSSLAGAGWTSNQDGAASNLAILNHLQDDGSSLPSLLLSHKTLRCGFGLKGIGFYTQTADVRMGGDEVEAAELFALGDGGDGLRFRSASHRVGIWKVARTHSSHGGQDMTAEGWVCGRECLSLTRLRLLLESRARQARTRHRRLPARRVAARQARGGASQSN